jgi:acetate kinase
VRAHLPEGASHEDALAALLRWLERRFPQHRLIAAGHRIVHGGSVYKAPVRIDAAVVAELTRLIPLAPLHQPHHLAAIAALTKLHPALLQIACFDTSFHHTQPEVAADFALPRRFTEEGVLRYGFHGRSYEYIASVLPEVGRGRRSGRSEAPADDYSRLAGRGPCARYAWRHLPFR